MTQATPVHTRIRGIDMARALAIVGMVMVHVGPRDLEAGGVVGAAYRVSHGRASIGFIVLAGIGVALLAGDRSRGRLSAATVRLGWRAIVLLPAGLALQTLDINVAVILQYYAVYFLVAAALMRLSDRWLLVVAAASGVLGPVARIMIERSAPHLYESGVPAWHDLARITRDILATGYYPVIVWTAPLALGIWIGRRNLRSPAVVRAVTAAGVAAAAAGFVLSDALVARFGEAGSLSDWRNLYVIEPHNEMPLWVLTATGIAVAVIGVCLLLAARAPTVVWPLVALGQLALSTYVVHLIVLELWPHWLMAPDDYAAAWTSVARFTVVAMLLAVAYRAAATRGPFELLLRPPLPGRSADRAD